MPFNGLRVLSLESRRAEEMDTLIRKTGGEPFVAPSMVRFRWNNMTEALHFADRLLRGEFDCVILRRRRHSPALENAAHPAMRRRSEKSPSAPDRDRPRTKPPPPFATRSGPGVPGSRTEIPGRELLTVMQERPETQAALQDTENPTTDLIDGLVALGKKSPLRFRTMAGIFPKTPLPCAMPLRN